MYEKKAMYWMKLTVATLKSSDEMLLFCMMVFVSITSVGSDLSTFDEKIWTAASNYLKEGFDPIVKPCDDFMKFSCGKWASGEISKNTSLLMVHDKFYREMIDAVERINIHDAKTPKYKVAVKTLYNTCHNGTKTNLTESVKELFVKLTNVIGMPPVFSHNKADKDKLTKENVWHLLGTVHREWPMSSLLFDVHVQTRATDCHGMQAMLRLAPKIDKNLDVDLNSMLRDVHQLAEVMDVKLDEGEVKKGAENVLEFKKALHSYDNETAASLAVFMLQNLLDVKKLPVALLTVDDLIKMNPNISWHEYFKGFFTEEQYNHWNQTQPMFTIVDRHYFDQIDKVVGQFDTETVFNYIFFRSMKQMFILLNHTNSDHATEDKAVACMEAVARGFKPAVARIYFDHVKLNPLELKYDLTIIAETVFSAMKFLIAGSTWLNGEEKLNIMKKVDGITFYPGIPEWLINNTEIDLRTIPLNPNVSSLENLIAMLKTNFARDLDYVFGVREVSQEDAPLIELNAFYNSMSITLEFIIFTPPMYHPKYPLAAKYGIMGYIIGHELMHGFDTHHIKEIPPSTKKWLSNITLIEYDKKTECVHKQYSAYCFKTVKKCVNGKNTINENLADIDGLKIAYMAYKFARETMEQEPPVPGFVDYTGDQLFFMFNARSRCSTGLEVEASMIRNDLGEPHSPETARVVVPFQNFPLFAKSFKCEVGSNYAPLHTCSVWGSYSDTLTRKA